MFNLLYNDDRLSVFIRIASIGLLREFPRDSKKNEFELAIVNEPSVFESLRFYCN